MVPTPTLETERLLLKPLAIADSEAAQSSFPKWEIVKFFLNTVPWPYPADGALTYIRDVALPAVERGEEWVWTICLRANPEKMIGSIRVFGTGNENRGYWLVPEYQGAGLMLEACQATNHFWFTTLERPILGELKAAANIASVRLSERQQMRLIWEGERDFLAGRLPAQIWALTAEEWHSSRNR